MRLAFALSGKRRTDDAIHVARQLEDAGIDEVWITEDYFERGAFAIAGALLASTTRLRVGIGVVNPWTRHPVLTAMETGALEELAPGRVILGLGASNVRWMEHQLGIPFERPLARLEECVTLVRDALRGDELNHDGIVGRVHAQLALAPAATPIALGVKGPKALELAGRVADGVLLSVLSAPAYVRWARERLGRVLPEGLSSYIAVHHDPDRAAAHDHIRPFVAAFLGVHGDHPITRAAGLDPELGRCFADGWRSARPRVDLVTDELIDTFVVAGDLDDLTTGLQRFADSGLDTAVMHDQRPADLTATIHAVQQAAALGGAGGASCDEVRSARGPSRLR